MQDHETLCDITRQRLAELRAAGCVPTDEEIIRLNALGWRRQSPRYRIALSRGIPVQVGTLTLWPRTMQAEDWYDRVGCSLRCSKYALAYSMACCYDDAAQWPEDGKEAEKTVTRWALSLKVHPDTLTEAMSQVMRQDESHPMPPAQPGDQADPMTQGDVSAWLTAHGGTPAQWERDVCASYARDWLRIKLASLNQSGETMESSPEFRASMAFGYLCEQIKERCKNGK